jgi:hypothetical protein
VSARTFVATAAILTTLAGAASAQQIADSTFAPPIVNPAFASGKGPVVLLDQGHGNFHTASGRYRPFAEFLRRDGYVVEPFPSKFTASTLRDARVLVVANPLAEVNQQNWSLPTPSAFTDSEVVAVRDWVEHGGALFLICDHMPFPGAAERLAAAFGARWNNGFALAKDETDRNPFVFSRANGGLADHPVTNGRTAAERIESVATFTGSAFEVTGDAVALLVLRPDIESLMPQVAWQFSAETPRVAVGGWPQAAALRRGRGRVVLCGEAAMFSAQVAGPDRVPMGMNAPVAAQNPQFLLNVMHWLTGLIDPSGVGATSGQ